MKVTENSRGREMTVRLFVIYLCLGMVANGVALASSHPERERAFEEFPGRWIHTYAQVRNIIRDSTKPEEVKLRKDLGYVATFAARPKTQTGVQNKVEALSEVAEQRQWTPKEVKEFKALLVKKLSPLDREFIQLWTAYFYYYVLHHPLGNHFHLDIEYFKENLGRQTLKELITEGNSGKYRFLFDAFNGEIPIDRLVRTWKQM